MCEIPNDELSIRSVVSLPKGNDLPLGYVNACGGFITFGGFAQHPAS
jgi:hypothetical protein